MKSIFSTATTAISQAGERTKRAAEKATRASLESVAQATNATKELFTHEEKIKKVLENDKILVRLKGNVWKRRGGVSGKLASYATAWELRPFVLKGSALLYYEKSSSSSISSQKRRSSSTKTTTETNNKNNNEDNANNNDDQEEFVFPRGFLDLVEEGASVQASLGHSAGAPSPFCISIKVAISVGGMVNTAQQETKWKLCFDSHATMMEWLVAMSDVVVRSSVDAYNHALLESADPNSRINPYLKPPPVYEPTSSGDAKNIQQHRLWMMEFYRVQSSLLEHNNHNHSNTSTTTASTAIDNSLQVMNTLLSEKEKQRKHLEEKLNELSTQHQTLQTQLEETIKAKDKIQDEKKFMDSVLEQLRIVLEERDTTIAKLQEQQQQQQQQQQQETTTIDGEDNKDDDTDKDASIQRLTQENQELKASMELKIQALQEELFRSKQQQQQQQQGYDEFPVVVEKKEEEEIVNTSTATTTTPTTAAFLYRLDTESFDDDEFEDCVEN